jgi:hypothetical protein
MASKHDIKQMTRRQLLQTTAVAGSTLVAGVFHGSLVERLFLAAKPSAEFDATWGKGFMMPNDFLTIVYNTL